MKNRTNYESSLKFLNLNLSHRQRGKRGQIEQYIICLAAQSIFKMSHLDFACSKPITVFATVNFWTAEEIFPFLKVKDFGHNKKKTTMEFFFSSFMVACKEALLKRI